MLIIFGNITFNESNDEATVHQVTITRDKPAGEVTLFAETLISSARQPLAYLVPTLFTERGGTIIWEEGNQ